MGKTTPIQIFLISLLLNVYNIVSQREAQLFFEKTDTIKTTVLYYISLVEKHSKTVLGKYNCRKILLIKIVTIDKMYF